MAGIARAFRLLVWFIGSAAFIFAIDRYGYWHEVRAFALVTLAYLWIVGGAFVVSMRGGPGGPATRPGTAWQAAAQRAAESAAKERAEREAAK